MGFLPLSWRYYRDLASHYAVQALYKVMRPIVMLDDARAARDMRRQADRLEKMSAQQSQG